MRNLVLIKDHILSTFACQAFKKSKCFNNPSQIADETPFHIEIYPPEIWKIQITIEKDKFALIILITFNIKILLHAGTINVRGEFPQSMINQSCLINYLVLQVMLKRMLGLAQAT